MTRKRVDETLAAQSLRPCSNFIIRNLSIWPELYNVRDNRAAGDVETVGADIIAKLSA